MAFTLARSAHNATNSLHSLIYFAPETEQELTRAGLRAGRIGAPQVERIARTWANPRIREAFVELDATVAELAARSPYEVLDRMLTEWEATADEDGAADAAARAHRDRDARIGQGDGEPGWEGSFRCGSLDGAQLHDIYDAFHRAELEDAGLRLEAQTPAGNARRAVSGGTTDERAKAHDQFLDPEGLR